MAVVPWASLGGGQLMSAEDREKNAKDLDARKGYGMSENDIKVCDVLEKISKAKGVTLQAVVSLSTG